MDKNSIFLLLIFIGLILIGFSIDPHTYIIGALAGLSAGILIYFIYVLLEKDKCYGVLQRLNNLQIVELKVEEKPPQKQSTKRIKK